MHASFVRLLAIFTLILASLLPGRATAQNQTNDPLVNQQQYLFDVHNIDQAWNYTTGSSNVTIGLYSMLGFIQNHEDLSSSRLKSPVGSLLKPKLDVASQMAGIVGANTNNGVGMAGIDRAAQLQSYSALRSTPECPQDCDEEEAVTVDRPNGATETYYLNLYQFSDIVEQGRTNGVDVHLFSFGLPSPFPPDYDIPEPQDSISVNLPRLPNTPWDAVKQVAVPAFERANSNALCGNPFGIPLTWLLGDCTSRPNPYQQFSESVSSAVAKDGAAVVGPAGDLDVDGDLPTRFTPGLRDRYAVTVGGVEFNDQFDLVKWSNTRPAPYVDVAGFAKNVVGVSGAGSSKYDTDFTSTAASASIGAGVASFLKAEMPALTGEDIEEILKRTARDAGPPGEDEATGTGAIDADAALSYVRNNDVQRSRQSVKSVISKKKIRSGVDLKGDRYWNFTPVDFQSCPLAQGDLYEFKARVPYSQTFSNTPDVWVRWGKSNGYNSRIGQVSHFNPLIEGIQVINADERGLTIRGHYWEADFFSSWGSRCAKDQRIPKRPKNFNIAYTAVGTEGPPPLYAVSVSGPTTLDEGEQGTWTAPPLPTDSSPSYTWFVDQGNGWSHLGTGSPITWSKDRISSTLTVDLKVEASEGNETATAQAEVIINNNDGTPGCDSGGGGRSPNRICYADGSSLVLRNVRAETHPRNTATVMWQADGRTLPSEFVLQHRADSTGAWSTLGTVPASDSARINASRAAAYRYQTGTLEIGTHQFRVGLPQGAAPGPRAAGTSDPESARRYAEPVTATITMDEAYRLSTYPNPVRGRATVELAVKERQNVQVRLYDLLGRQVATLHNGPLPAQELRRLRLDVSATGLTSGTYFLRVKGEDVAATEQMTVVR